MTELYISSEIPDSYDKEGFEKLKWTTLNDAWISKEDLLAAIQDTLDEYRMAMKTKDSNGDYLDGGMTALKFLATSLGICEYRDLED